LETQTGDTAHDCRDPPAAPIFIDEVVAELAGAVIDLTTVVEWAVSQKTPIGGVAAALQRLREVTTKLETYKGNTT
jgi:hypothetical protein